MFSEKIIGVYGGGGHGHVVADIAVALGYETIVFIDDSPAKGITFNEFISQYTCSVAIGIGDNSTRSSVYDMLVRSNIRVETLVHPSVIISPSVEMGAGTVVMPGSVVNARAKIGKGCILNTSCVIEHDCFLGDFVHVSPNGTFAGGAKAGDFSHIGICACLLPGVEVGKGTVIGAGAVVTKEIPGDCVAYGNPARIRRMK